MIKPFFSSSSETSLITIVSQLLQEVSQLDKNKEVEIQIMIFSFTEKIISDQLLEIAKGNPNLMIRVLADWGNISNSEERKTRGLAEKNIKNIQVRFKYDQPYLWDEEQNQLRWNYNASLGLLHHKSICLFIDQQPIKLITGSYNWTKKGGENYENLIELNFNHFPEILSCFEEEFAAIWIDSELSLSFKEALKHVENIQDYFKSNPKRLPEDFIRLNKGKDGSYFRKPINKRLKTIVKNNNLVAFSATHPISKINSNGFSSIVNKRYFNMMKNSGKEKLVPLTLNTLSLDIIARAKAKTTLRVAMYALSVRVPEYNALLEAARRGVFIKIIFDRSVNIFTMERLSEVINKEKINIEIRAGKRGMHQKYIVDESEGNVLTGTANMTTDSMQRHAEHRFLFKSNPELAEAFTQDFETIWNRITLR